VPSIKIINGLEPGMEGFETQQRLAAIFEKCLDLQVRKASTYGDAFRSQGYMGNVARVLSKASRLKKMVWRDWPIEDSEEPVMDTVHDLINLAGFFIINYSDRNKWGH
jgi:hypothetical protein